MLDLHSVSIDDLSGLARGVVGSEILKIAGEVRALKAQGAEVCNLTVGDFDPAYFPIPTELLEGTRKAWRRSHHYRYLRWGAAPAEAVALFYERAGAELPGGVGAGPRRRPPRCCMAPTARWWIRWRPWSIRCPAGTTTTTPTLSGAKAVGTPSPPSPTSSTLAQIAPHLGTARMLVVNSP